MGAFNPDRRWEIYDNIDILVVPSRWESYSLVCREALMSGIPVIASRISPLTDVVVDQVNGYLFEPEDDERLTAILKRIANQPEVISSLSLPGPITIPTQIDHVRAIEMIYTRAIDRHKSPGQNTEK